MNKTFAVLVVALAAATLLRLPFPQMIEFGYDQPRFAQVMIHFLQSPSIIEGHKVIDLSPWGSYSYFLWQMLVWSPLFMLSINPVVVSQLASVVMLLTIVFVGLSVKKIPGGIFATLLIGTHFWNTIFSHEIYTSTPPLTIGAFIMYLTLTGLQKKWRLTFVIPLSAIMLSTAMANTGWVIGTLLLLIFVIPKRNILVGAVMAIVVMSPTIAYHIKYPESIQTYFSKTDFEVRPWGEHIVLSTGSYVRTLASANIRWHTGYATPAFVEKNPWYPWFEGVASIVVIITLLYHFAMIRSPQLRWERMFLLMWTVSPAVFVTGMHFHDSVPRYFIIAIASYAVLLAWMLANLVKHKYAFVFLIILLSNIQALVVLRYYDFALNYTYPHGFMSYFSDTPIVFLERALQWVEQDAQVRGDGYTIESSIRAVNYYTDNILESQGVQKTLYSIEYRNDKTIAPFVSGPYAVTRL